MYIAVILAIAVAAIVLQLVLFRHVQKSGKPLAECSEDPPVWVTRSITRAADWTAPSDLGPHLARRLGRSSPEMLVSDSDGYVLVRLHGYSKLNSGVGSWIPGMNVAIGFDGKEAIVGADYAVGWWLNEDTLKKTVDEQICKPLVQIADELGSGRPPEETSSDR